MPRSLRRISPAAPLSLVDSNGGPRSWTFRR
ncbi:hypothetical protein RB213_012890 [Colletotrichum asianum]